MLTTIHVAARQKGFELWIKFCYNMYPSPDNPPQDADKSCHLSDSTNTTDSSDESSMLSVQEDHLLQVDSTSLSSQL